MALLHCANNGIIEAAIHESASHAHFEYFGPHENTRAARPREITSTNNVFPGAGYKETSCYMGLMVNTPGIRVVKTLFRGETL
jgi:hypothetical protein